MGNGGIMKKTLILIFAVLFLVSCSKGGVGGDDDVVDDDIADDSDEPTIEEQISVITTTARTYLSNGNINDAKTTYTEAIDALSIAASTSAKSTGGLDLLETESYFGRAFCNIILITQQTFSTNMLAAFNESPWSLDSIFGESGYFYTGTKSLLPFSPLNCSHRKTWPCVLSKTTSGYRSTNLISSLVELNTYLDDIVADLAVAIGTTNGTYTIPKGLYNGSDHLKLNIADMTQTLAGIYAIKAAIELVYSWTFDIDLSTLFNSNGNFIPTSANFVASLNDQFSLKSTNFIAQAKDNLYHAFHYSNQSINLLLAGATNGVLNITSSNTQEYTELAQLAQAAVDSFSSYKILPNIQPEITATLETFFTSPPNIESDAFVMNGNHIEAVESFWQQMINNACNYNLTTKPGVTIFSATVRNMSRPYKGLFDQIFGNKFGPHTL